MKYFTNVGQFHKGITSPRKGYNFIFPNMTGLKFGKWTVIKELKRKGNWEVLCDCGVKSELKGYCLRRGSSKSCGCTNIEKLQNKRLPNNLAAKNKLFAEYIRNANNRGYIFQIDFNDFCNFISDNCFYCGSIPINILKPNHRNKKELFFYNGIDRIDNSNGYFIENLVTCCGLCNQAKMDLSQKDFLSLVEKIFNKHLI